MQTQGRYLIRGRTAAAIIHSLHSRVDCVPHTPPIFSHYFSIPRSSKELQDGERPFPVLITKEVKRNGTRQIGTGDRTSLLEARGVITNHPLATWLLEAISLDGRADVFSSKKRSRLEGCLLLTQKSRKGF
jgi:hypothetical protein